MADFNIDVNGSIANDSVTNAKLANEAQATLKGRAAGAGTGDPQDLTADQASTILDTATDPFVRTSAIPGDELTADELAAIQNAFTPSMANAFLTEFADISNTTGTNATVAGDIATAANAKVADAINDGVTTIAPSQNAVFDALALKQNTISFGTGVQTALGVNVGTAGAPVINGGALGTPSSGVATNLTGTAAGLTAGTVTTNANLTGPVTSVGNATAIADGALSIAKTSGLQAALDLKAALASPTFTGTPVAPTAATGTSTTQVATTAFVQQEIDATFPIAVLASTQTTTSATLVDVTGFSIAVDAGATYQMEGFLICQTATATTNGIWLSLNGPTIGAGTIVHNWTVSNTATANNARNNVGYNTGSASTDSPGIDTSFAALMNGTFIVGATGGTLQVRFASENAGTTVRVMAGSSLRLTRIA